MNIRPKNLNFYCPDPTEQDGPYEMEAEKEAVRSAEEICIFCGETKAWDESTCGKEECFEEYQRVKPKWLP